jgi:hypothetical protein
MTMPVFDGVKKHRLDFATTCVAEVFPSARDDHQPKRIIFQQAALWGMTQDDRPSYFRYVSDLRTYIRNHWPVIRLMLPEQEGFMPVYVNGTEFGGGGGYRKGDQRHVRKQLERDAKITDGVVNAANGYAEATGLVFPSIETSRRTLVSRRIER